MKSNSSPTASSSASARGVTGIRLAATLAVKLLLTTATATAGDPVYIWPEFDKGDRFSFELVKTRERRGTSQPDLKGTATTLIDVEVLEISPEGIVLSWTYGKTETDPPPEAFEPLAALVDAAVGLRLEIQIDERGVVTGLRNYTEVKQKYHELMNKLFDGLGEGGMPAAELRTLRGQMERLISTKETIEGLLLREAQVYLVPIGWNLDPDAPTEYDDLLPNPFGGEPIPAKARIALVGYKPGAKQTRIEFRQQMDPEGLSQSMKSTLGKMAGDADAPEPPDELAFEVTDESEFTIDAEFGWITKARMSRLIRSGDSRMTDTTVFRLKSHQPAQAVDKGKTTTDKQPSP